MYIAFVVGFWCARCAPCHIVFCCLLCTLSWITFHININCFTLYKTLWYLYRFCPLPFSLSFLILPHRLTIREVTKCCQIKIVMSAVPFSSLNYIWKHSILLNIKYCQLQNNLLILSIIAMKINRFVVNTPQRADNLERLSILRYQDINR